MGGLEAEAEWSHVLSLGEQQRVAFLRLLLHAPKLAFLDEATGALDSATEAALYTRLRGYCTSYISVGACSRSQLACRAFLPGYTAVYMGVWAWHIAIWASGTCQAVAASDEGWFLGCRAQDGAAAVPHTCAGARGRHQVAAEHCGGLPGKEGRPVTVHAVTAILFSVDLR